MARDRWNTLLAPLILALPLVLPVPAQSQDIRSPYRFVDETQALGAFGGYIVTDQGSAELGPQSAPVLGARYTIRLNGPFSVEGEMGFMPTHRTVWDIQDGERTRVGDADLSLLLLSAGLRFNMTGSRTYHDLMPYLVVAGGAAIRAAGDDSLDLQVSTTDARYRFGTSFAGHLGGGVEWFGLGPVTLRGDARVLLWELESPAAFVRLQPGLPSREWAQNYMLSASVSYRF
jgi:hypothetical protein